MFATPPIEISGYVPVYKIGYMQIFKPGGSSFQRSIAMVFQKSPSYDFILLSKTYQCHLETWAANVWDLVQSDQSLFQ